MSVTTVPSFCRICTAGCGTMLTIGDDNEIIGVRGDPDNKLSNGYACFKGLQAEESHHGPERLLHPLKRQPDGSYARIGLEQALDEIAAKIDAIIRRGGPDAVAAFVGNGAFFNSTAYRMVPSFLKAIGSRQFFTTLTIDQSGKIVSFGRLGGWAAGFPDAEKIDVALLISCNTLISHAAVGLASYDPVKRLKKLRANGLKLIVIDPRRTETARNADLAIQPYPGQDSAILGGLIRMILAENWEDKEFCAQHVGADRMKALRDAVTPLTPEHVEERAGLESGQLRAVAEMFARDAKTGFASAGTGINMTPFSNLAQHLVDCLNVICGRFLREGDAVHAQSAMTPAMPIHGEVMPAMREWEEHGLSRIRGTHTIFGERPTGTLTDEILTPGEGQIRALIVDGGDPLTSFPDPRKTVKAMETLDLLVSIDPWATPTTSFAHYILPPVMQYERADLPMVVPGFPIWPGGWAQYTPPLVAPPTGSEVTEDWYVFWSIAKRLGSTIVYDGKVALDKIDPPTCDDLLAIQLTGARATLKELKRHPHGHDFGTESSVVLPAQSKKRHQFDVMPTDVAGELASFISQSDRPGTFMRDGKAFTHLLSTRRMRDLFNGNGKKLRSVRKRNPFNPAFLNPTDMANLGISPGQRVELVSAHGRTIAIAGADENLRSGVVNLSHGWGGIPGSDQDPTVEGTNVNLLIDIDRNFETINAMPHISAVPVNINPLP